MEHFAYLEEQLKSDRQYLENKILERTGAGAEQEVADLFHLGELISAFQQFKGPLTGDTLMEYVAHEVKEPDLSRLQATVKRLLVKEKLGAWAQRAGLAPAQGVEEVKQPQQQANEEEELVKLYGPRVKVVQWLYEGALPKPERGKKTLGKRRRQRQLSYSSSEDEYGMEEAQKPKKTFENIDGTEYRVLEDQASCKSIEEAYQLHLATGETQSTYIELNEEVFEVKFTAGNHVWQIMDTAT